MRDVEFFHVKEDFYSLQSISKSIFQCDDFNVK